MRGNPRFLGVVELLLDPQADIRALDNYGALVLRGAVELGTPEMVEVLLKRGADPNQQTAGDEQTESLIDIALERSRIAVADLLLSRGTKFDPNASWQLHAAATNGRLEVMLWLLDHGADISRRDEQGDTPLLTAASSGHDASQLPELPSEETRAALNDLLVRIRMATKT